MNRKILSLALPSIAANITTPLLGLVDTAITGHMGSAVYIGAIAVGGVMFNMLYWLFSFLRGGTSGLAAQACGAADDRAATIVLRRSLLVAASVGVAMIMLQWPLQWLLEKFVDPDGASAAQAALYFRILIYGAPAVLCTYALSGWFLGMQQPKYLVVISLVINLCNIALSLLLVYGAGMKIAGVALGTLTAQWIGFTTALLLLRRFKLQKVSSADVLNRAGLRRFFTINAEMMVRTACLIAVTVWFTRMGARQGAVMLAVNTLLMQLFLLASYMLDGFAFAAEALAGKFVGAGDRTSLHRCVKLCMGWSLVLSLMFTAFYWIGGERFLGILTSDGDVITASQTYFFWALTVPLAGFAAFVWDGVFIGTTLTRQLMWSMLGAMLTFFALQWWLYPLLGNHALWLAFIAYLLMRGLLQTILFYKHNRT